MHASCLHVLLIIHVSEYWKKIDRQKACSSLLPKVCLFKGWGNMRFLHSTLHPNPISMNNVFKHQIMKAGLMVRRLSYLGLDFKIKLKVQTGDPQGLLVSYLSYTPNKTKVTVKNNLLKDIGTLDCNPWFVFLHICS